MTILLVYGIMTPSIRNDILAKHFTRYGSSLQIKNYRTAAILFIETTARVLDRNVCVVVLGLGSTSS